MKYLDPTINKMSPQFLVEDIERSIGFYIGKLGFKIDFRHADFYAGISRDGFSVHLKHGTPSAEERQNRRTGGHLDILFSLQHIDGFYSYVLNEAVEVVQPLRAMEYGREFYVADPDGYIIGFLEEAG